MQSRFDKVIIPGKVDRLNKKKFKIKKDKDTEVDVDIDVEEDGDFEVEKLSLKGLPEQIDGITIRWFNNFAIKKDGKNIHQRYFVTIPGIDSSKSKIVIFDSTGLHYYEGKVTKNTIELTDGDPGLGGAP